MDSIKYLSSDLMNDVHQDVVAVAKLGLARFGVPRSVFCYVDHLGYLAYGLSGSTERAVKFMSEFFPARYHDLAELIIHMWRHAVVHEHRPRSLSTTLQGTGQNVEIHWLSTTHDRARERGLHLLVLPIQGRPNAAYLDVNNPQLGDDLIEAIGRFSTRLTIDASLKSQCDARVATSGTPQPLSKVKNAGRRQAIVAEIEEAWKARGGLIDAAGNVIQPHPHEPGGQTSAQHVVPPDRSASPRGG